MTRRRGKLSKEELAQLAKESRSDVLDYETSMELFTDDCKGRELRPHTIKYYHNELKVYKSYLNELEFDSNPQSVTENMIDTLIRYMQKLELKTVTINSRLRAIRSYFNFLYKKKYIKENPVEELKLLKDRKTIIETFSEAQLNKLLRQPDLQSFIGLRDYAIMKLLLDTGIRVSELVGIDV